MTEHTTEANLLKRDISKLILISRQIQTLQDFAEKGQKDHLFYESVLFVSHIDTILNEIISDLYTLSGADEI